MLALRGGFNVADCLHHLTVGTGAGVSTASVVDRVHVFGSAVMPVCGKLANSARQAGDAANKKGPSRLDP